MKRHHVVGIIAGICGIGLTVDRVLSGNIIGWANIIDAVVTFILLSIVALSTFLKDRLPLNCTNDAYRHLGYSSL